LKFITGKVIFGNEIKMILPEGLRKVLSLNTKTKAFISITGSLKGKTDYTVYLFEINKKEWI